MTIKLMYSILFYLRFSGSMDLETVQYKPQTYTKKFILLISLKSQKQMILKFYRFRRLNRDLETDICIDALYYAKALRPIQTCQINFSVQIKTKDYEVCYYLVLCQALNKSHKTCFHKFGNHNCNKTKKVLEN